MACRGLSLFILVTGLTLASGCTVVNDGGGNGVGGNAISLQGSWSSACVAASGTNLWNYSKTTYVFSGLFYSLTQAGYGDSACSTELDVTVNSSGTFAVGAAVTGVR